ncbi:ACT protein tyrosine kinase family protein [Trifolium repens]|nr:ACT protein tyrosine kinase family protein [Trifolium repens]
MQVYPFGSTHYNDSSEHSDRAEKDDAQSSLNYSLKQGIHPPPTFGSSSNLEALALQTNKNNIEDGDNAMGVTPNFNRPMHEITFSTIDKPKLLSQVVDSLKFLLYFCKTNQDRRKPKTE